MILLLAGCPDTLKDDTADSTGSAAAPWMVIEDATLDLGTLPWGDTVSGTLLLSNIGGRPLGVDSIRIGDGARGVFEVDWHADDVTCPDATAKGDSGDSGHSAPEDPGDVPLVIDPGCLLPLTVTYTAAADGDTWDAVVVTSDDVDGGEVDPLHGYVVSYLHGATAFTQPRVSVTPRSEDFGFLYPGTGSDTVDVTVSNVGDADLTISDIGFSSCGSDFALTTPTFPYVVPGGLSTVATAEWTPSTLAPAYCIVEVYTDDPASPVVDVTLTGNTGSPVGTAPEVEVTSPTAGSSTDGIDPFVVTLSVFDADQPPSTLACVLESAVLGTALSVDCAPPDDTGVVEVEIPAADLATGIDTLRVTVTDAMGLQRLAAVSIRTGTDFPTGDDDFDGYDESSTPADCDDADAATYPEAAEIYDGVDNDCGGTVDEGTAGFDDDGDGETEAAGDCDDEDSTCYSGAPERGDGLDNDCDGTIDETTSLGDDDGDGYAEVNNDCDDSDPAVSPTATEICDGIDNDCDGLRDTADGCVEENSDPYVAGDVIRTAQTSVAVGESTELEIYSYDAESDPVAIVWTSDNGEIPSGSDTTSVTFTGASAGAISVYVVITADDGGQDWAFTRITVR